MTLPSASLSGVREQARQNWLPILVLIATCTAYGWFIYANALNVPFHDDILDVLKAMLALIHGDSAGSVTEALLTQHNDHRTTASRLIYLAFYKISGSINFRSLTFIANLALPVLALLFWSQIRNAQSRWLLFLPVVFLMFQLKVYGISVWTMAAFAFFFVYMYGIAALFCLHSPTPWRFVAAIFLAVLATYSIASGQVIWPVGLLCLLHQSVVLKRIPLTYAVLWILAALLALGVYRAGLETPNTLLTLLQFALESPGRHTQYFLGMLGSAVSFDQLRVAQLIGVALLLFLLWQTLQRFRSGYSKLDYACWFIVLSAIAVVLGRAPYSLVQYSQESRYSVASTLLLACVWLLLAERFKLSRLSLFAAAIISGGVCSASYFFYTPKFEVLMEKRVAAFNRADYRVYGQPPAVTNSIVAEAIAEGIYRPPVRPLPLRSKQ